MFCSKCGNEIQTDSRFCSRCGQQVENQNVDPRRRGESTPRPLHQEAGRGGLILTFGILSLVVFGPILGIPAWVMGNGDLKKIRSGIIAISQQGLTQTGMILGIIGTFFGFVGLIIVGIAIAIGISQFGAHSTQANKDGISQALVNIAANAYQYKIRPTSMGGGGGRYTGYKIPSTMAKDDNGIYTIRMIAIDDITIIGTSAINTSWAATITADDTGKSTISFDGW